MAIEPPVVASGVSRIVTIRLTNTDPFPLGNVVVGLDIPAEFGLEQGRASFEIPLLGPDAVHEHPLRIRPSRAGRQVISVRNLSCRDGDGRTHRERRRTMEILVEHTAAEMPVFSGRGGSVPLSRRRSVFVSYRRRDTKLMVAGLVRDLGQRKSLRLVDLFLDLTDISPGAEWPRVLEAELGTCDILVAVIGPNWLTPRLRDPGDIVRREITTVLDRGVPVVPLLVDAHMPNRGDLVPELWKLTDRQAFSFDVSAYGASVARLAAGLKRLLDASTGDHDGQRRGDVMRP